MAEDRSILDKALKPTRSEKEEFNILDNAYKSQRYMKKYGIGE